MKNDDYQSTFSRALLTGVFVGFVSTLACLLYNVLYRDSTGFLPADIINVSSLIFAVNLLFLVIGVIYYFFLKNFKKGDLIFTVLFIVLTVLLCWRDEHVSRSADHGTTVEFRGLLLGITIILGLSAALIPYLFHSKKFHDHVV